MTGKASKICLLGKSNVGKSSISMRFAEDRFDEAIPNTIGAAFLTSYVTTDKGTTFKLQIWDTAGQERYKSLAPMYYRGAAAVIIVFDLTNRDSLAAVEYWIKELRVNGPPQAVLALVGNKLDLAMKDRQVEEEGKNYAASIDAIYAETSAKTGENIAQLFKEICCQIEKRNSYVDVSFANDLSADDRRPTNSWRFGIAKNDWMSKESGPKLQLRNNCDDEPRRKCCGS